ncbi:hypothetical protein DM860_011408 [Cuscuta australis]|uniref:Uncharacterized protein n=1 Tax=Cuscuta australis TaxID=267555 RepID=A0A328DUU0_9ASTE|nr:hypothetical protein DM860_011408 [Cuscuta australis]
MDIEAAELQDWEVLLPNPISVDSGLPDSSENPNDFQEIGADSQGIVHTDYFSLDTGESFPGTAAADFDVGELGSDNPSWIDPDGLEARYPAKESGESWPDSGSDLSDDRVFEGKGGLGMLQKDTIEGVFEGKGELGILQKGTIEGGFDGKGELGILQKNTTEGVFEGEGELGMLQKDTIEGVFDGIEEIGSEIEQLEGDADLKDTYAAAEEEEKQKAESIVGSEKQEIAGNKTDEIEDKKNKKKTMNVVGWKAPFELFKYYVLKSRHFGSLSVAAAAALGFAILGHRLYKMMMMKKRSKALEDGKKKVVLQFIGRGPASLYEAFSMAKQVPAAMIRPQQLPGAAAVIPWPVIALI